MAQRPSRSRRSAMSRGIGLRVLLYMPDYGYEEA